MKYIIPAAIAIGVGLVTLLSYFVPSGELLSLRLLLTNWAMIVGGLAILLGIFNLILVHFRRIQKEARGSLYSLLTVAAAVATFVIGALEGVRSGGSPLFDPASITHIIIEGVILASQAALAGLVMFFLVAAAAQMLKSRPNGWTVLFLASALIVLVGWLPFGFMSIAATARDWLLEVPVLAGARGILLGVALGTLAMGLRVLVGIERPYKD